MPVKDWNEHITGLEISKPLYHNDDYFEFLVRKVWKLSEPLNIVDFGCGIGYIGLKLLPLLPPGSKYTGVDNAVKLLEKGRELFSEAGYNFEFIKGDVRDIPLGDSRFDLAVSHAVLMHVQDPEKAISEMVRVCRNGGMVISCEANRNAHTAAFYIHETNEQESTPLDFFQKMNAGVRKKYGIDYNIGYKLPVLFHKAGLSKIEARTDDKVCCLFPPVEDPIGLKTHEAICSEGMRDERLSEQRYKEKVTILSELGLSKDEIEHELKREADRNFGENGLNWHTVWMGMMTWCWGKVNKA